MACWVVPSVASEIWHVPVDQILSAVKCGKLASKQENGFTFVDVAPNSPGDSQPLRAPKPKPITYKVVRRAGPPESYMLPRPAEVITPAEVQCLMGETGESGGDAPAESNSAMGDWRRGRRSATTRRTPPKLHIA